MYKSFNKLSYGHGPSNIETGENRDGPLCGCTSVDKDHEASITALGLANFFNLLDTEVSQFFSN